jgi:hypothetical protein
MERDPRRSFRRLGLSNADCAVERVVNEALESVRNEAEARRLVSQIGTAFRRALQLRLLAVCCRRKS